VACRHDDELTRTRLAGTDDRDRDGALYFDDERHLER
jgi:hypothetical protein